MMLAGVGNQAATDHCGGFWAFDVPINWKLVLVLRVAHASAYAFPLFPARA